MPRAPRSVSREARDRDPWGGLDQDEVETRPCVGPSRPQGLGQHWGILDVLDLAPHNALVANGCGFQKFW